MPAHKLNNDTLQLDCVCHHPEHSIRLMYDEDDLMIEYHLSSHGFFRRLVAGVKYIFGHKSKWGCFDEMMLDCEDAKAIGAFLGDYLRLNKYTVVNYVFAEGETIGEYENV